jgi:dienelactone hydrolase
MIARPCSGWMQGSPVACARVEGHAGQVCPDASRRGRRLRLRRAARGVVLAFVLACAAEVPVAAAPPVTFATATIRLSGIEEAVDIHRPASGPERGTVIIAHGFGRSRHRHFDLGRALAEAGVVAIVPDLPNVLDLWANGDAVADLEARVEAGAFGSLPVSRMQIVLMGTSAGGLATLLAAERLPGLAGWIGLDPVDRTGTGADAAAQLAVPAIVLLADGSPCNLFGSGRTLAQAAPQLVRSTKIEGTSHCDFESPTNNFCRVVCGTSTRDRESRVRDEAVAAALELLDLARQRTGPPVPGAPEGGERE